MAKKKHSLIVIFRDDTSPHYPVAYDTKLYRDIKQITSMQLVKSQVFDSHVECYRTK